MEVGVEKGFGYELGAMPKEQLLAHIKARLKEAENKRERISAEVLQGYATETDIARIDGYIEALNEVKAFLEGSA